MKRAWESLYLTTYMTIVFLLDYFFSHIKMLILRCSVLYTVKFYVTGVEDKFSLMDIIQIQ